MNIVFMGTPDFAVPSLEYLIRNNYNVSCVVTQPDRPKGRGNKIAFSPVKEKAVEYNLSIAQPERIRKDDEFRSMLKNLKPDVAVVVAFGQLLPPEVLSIPKYGCINIHASLLPKLRGAAPINWSIINGECETGITSMYMDAGLDTGDILISESTPIGENETAGELHDRLKIIGAEVLIKTLHSLGEGTLKRTPQYNLLSTYAPMLDRDTGRINWGKSSEEIGNLIRGTNPWPSAYSCLNGARIKIWSADIEALEGVTSSPGMVWKVDKSGIHVYTGNGGILIKEVQTENGRRIGAFDYTLGHPLDISSNFD